MFKKKSDYEIIAQFIRINSFENLTKKINSMQVADLEYFYHTCLKHKFYDLFFDLLDLDDDILSANVQTEIVENIISSHPIRILDKFLAHNKYNKQASYIEGIKKSASLGKINALKKFISITPSEKLDLDEITALSIQHGRLNVIKLLIKSYNVDFSYKNNIAIKHCFQSSNYLNAGALYTESFKRRSTQVVDFLILQKNIRDGIKSISGSNYSKLKNIALYYDVNSKIVNF